MNIAVFGATGRVGSRLLVMLLNGGYNVRALTRSPEKAGTHPAMQVIQGNVLTDQDVQTTISGADIVVSALGTDKQNTLQRAFPVIIEAMIQENVQRIISTGTAGILNARQNPDAFRFETDESKRRSTTAARDHANAYELLRQSSLDWTIACPTYLPEGEATGEFRTAADVLPKDGKNITTGDTALFLYQLAAGEESFYRRRAGLAY
ncbi:NAD(P)-dependent oxidoreductase [Salibacterium halotolerans]|uniref:Putative NADH-flavin reductase n=1 Tax=Salibacterium halotolerans TaxID=1884432 RepID=A0A1I5UI80_9BACI|nr:NAD(P)H-binding protein [Salibacterium halotolerans]SFP94994.1 Putative NADH-flavin reductase [Salibacterium halotolerans]